MRSYILLLFLLCSLHATAQVPRPDHIIDRNSGGFLELRPKSEGAPESVYIQDQWRTGKLRMQNQEITEVSMKFDLKNNLLEILTNNGIKILPVQKLQSFEIKNEIATQVFANSADLGISGLTGLVEVLATGRMSLYSQPYLEQRKANYNPALNIGERNDQYIKKERLLLIKSGTLWDVTRAGKKILAHFGEQADAMEKYARENGLSLKNRNDLVRIVSAFNETASQ